MCHSSAISGLSECCGTVHSGKCISHGNSKVIIVWKAFLCGFYVYDNNNNKKNWKGKRYRGMTKGVWWYSWVSRVISGGYNFTLLLTLSSYICTATSGWKFEGIVFKICCHFSWKVLFEFFFVYTIFFMMVFSMNMKNDVYCQFKCVW